MTQHGFICGQVKNSWWCDCDLYHQLVLDLLSHVEMASVEETMKEEERGITGIAGLFRWNSDDLWLLKSFPSVIRPSLC